MSRTLLALLILLSICIETAASNISLSHYKSFLVRSLAFFILLNVVAEFLLSLKIEFLARSEVIETAENLLSELVALKELKNLKNFWYIKDFESLREPLSRAISIVKVIRDGSVQWVPINMLVPGDIVDYKSLMDCDTSIIEYEQLSAITKPNSLVRILNCPAETQLREALKVQIATTPQKESMQWLFSNFLFTFTILSLLLLILHSFWIYFTSNKLYLDIYMFELYGLSILPIFLWTSPLLIRFVKLYSDCRMELMANFLLRSSTPFEEGSDVDEFDEEAPPPTKDIYIGPQLVLRNMLCTLFTKRAVSIEKSTAYFFDSTLFWSTDLMLKLASLSVIIYTDREAMLTLPFAIPERVNIPKKIDSDSLNSKAAFDTPPLYAGELSTIEIYADPEYPANISFSFLDDKRLVSDLKAIGLSLLLTTDCGIRNCNSRGYRKEWHRRFKLDSLKDFSGPLARQLQVCQCLVSKIVGFILPTGLSSYKRIGDFWLEPECCYLCVIGSATRSDPFFQMFLVGPAECILQYCSYTWDGSQIGKLTQDSLLKIQAQVEALKNEDYSCLAYCYRPIINMSYEQLKTAFVDNASCRIFARRQLESLFLLGIIASCLQDSDSIQEYISDLDAAGIRFVYFSPHNELTTKAFGERLGLETDWNSCILLSNPPEKKLSRNNLLTVAGNSEEETFFSHPKSRMPRGVDNVRPHLENVDDIPLHVSLFAECSSSAMLEMIKIYREYGETVAVFGSALNHASYSCFCEAHLAISMHPTSLWNKALLSNLNVNPKSLEDKCPSQLSISAAFTGLRSSLKIPFETNPYVFTELIREARLLYRCCLSVR